MMQILQKTLIAPFYKVNFGFFLFCFLLLFGIMNAHDALNFHIALMNAITTSPLYLCAAMAVWAMYSIKCVAFVQAQLSGPENSFLYNMQAIKDSRQYWALLRVHAAIYLPVLLHGIITAVLGFKQHHILLALVTLCFHALMCGAAAFIYLSSINNAWKTPLFQLPSFIIFRHKRPWTYLLHYSLQNRKAAFATVKVFSLLMLQAMVLANSDALSREAICVLILFSIAAHSLLPFYYVQFMEGMPFLRNLPVSVLRRFAVYPATYAIIMLPELLFLLYNAHTVLSLSLILSLYALSVAQMCLYTALQYLRNINSERYMGFVAGLFFSCLMLLTSVNLWVLATFEMVMAACIYIMLYERYEVTANVQE